MIRFRGFIKNSWATFILGLLIGALIILAIRFATYAPADQVHYHANFAVYINGQREQFKEAFYYEDEGAACTETANMTPKDRAHMHDNVNSVIHVHDHAVTWNQFFNNIGWSIDPTFISTPTNLYVADTTHKVTFILNGQTTDNIVDRVIGDKDRLLVDYGGDSANLKAEYGSVPATAAQEDASTDPASCGGSAPTTMRQRMDHMF